MADGRGIAFASIGVGVIFLYAGLKGKSVTQSFQYLLTGKNPENAPAANAITGSGASTSGTAAPGDTGASSASASENQAIAKMLAQPYGWSTGVQWEDLVSLWNRESGWSVSAKNPTSGAYGIPQALPASKMASAGSDWKYSAATQIAWGLQYIQERYGSPSAAWAHEESVGWY